MKKILIQAAMGAIKKKDSFYHAKHNQLRFRLGSYNKATVAIANRMARAIYEILKHREVCFQDLGGQRVDSREKQIQRTLAKLKTLGVEVLYDPVKQRILEKTAAAA